MIGSTLAAESKANMISLSTPLDDEKEKNHNEKHSFFECPSFQALKRIET